MTAKKSSKKKDQNSWLGLDIGGANLKLAHSNVQTAWSKSLPFAMWKESTQLASALARAIDDSPEFQGIAVTMTGELADCFATRAQGVACILDQVTSYFQHRLYLFTAWMESFVVRVRRPEILGWQPHRIGMRWRIGQGDCCRHPRVQGPKHLGLWSISDRQRSMSLGFLQALC